MPDITDQQLIADYAHGDEHALSVLVNRHLKSIYNFVYRLTGNTHDAEDISQETFLKMWRHLRTYRPHDNFKTWLYAIARNTAIDWLRKKKHLTFSDFENEEGENMLVNTLADPSPLPDALVTHIENKHLMESLLSRVPLMDKEILLLHYDQQFTFDEIGKIMKQPLNTVKSRHRRALIALRKLIDAPK